MMKSGIVRFGAIALFASAVAGCVSIGGGSDEPEQLIGLTARESAPAGPAASGNVSNSILVFEPEVEDRLDVKRVPVQVSETGIAYLANAFYVEKPARLMQHLLAETLRARTGRLVIEGPDPAVETKTRIYGRLIEMGYSASTSTVTVTFDAISVSPEGEVEAQRFSHSVPGVMPEAASVAPALNEAANEVVIGIADWMAG